MVLGVEEQSKKEKRLMDMDNSVVIVVRGEAGIKELNSNGKSTLKYFLKQKMFKKVDQTLLGKFFFKNMNHSLIYYNPSYLCLYTQNSI